MSIRGNDVSKTDPNQSQGFGKLASPEFWGELVVKQGITALIAVYLVYSITSQQQQALQRLEAGVSQLGLKLDRISDKLTK